MPHPSWRVCCPIGAAPLGITGRGYIRPDLSSLHSARTRSCGLTVIVVGAAALVGWAANEPILLGVRPNYIPMAPNTALAFVVMGLGLMLVDSPVRLARGCACAGAALVALLSVLRLIEMAAGLDIDVDGWFFRVPSARFGLAELGKMSYFTAAAFVASGTGLAMLAGRSRPRGDR